MNNTKEGGYVDWPSILDGTQSLKFESDWSKYEDVEAHGISQYLNSFYNRVDKNISRLNNTCSSVEEAWETL